MKPADFGLLFAVCLIWALNLVISRWTVSLRLVWRCPCVAR